jgi:hypothetical protein
MEAKHRKSQMQIGETVAVLVVFFFLLVIGMVFYVNIATTKVEESRFKNTELEAVNAMKRALSLPELQCSHNNIVDESCVDMHKLAAAKDAIEANRAAYFDLFGTSVITIKQIYPSAAGGGGAVLLYNYPLEAFSSRLNTSTPISLLNTTAGTYAFGIIEIVTYGK